jgi:trans-o-hydroxybenzylidenepyruvate hydratase-aldolase
MPTPGTPGGDNGSVTDSVDLVETERLVRELVRSGVSVIATCGTTGEGAALLWEEKQAFTDTVIQTVGGRIPVFAGCTALGTKEVVRQMRAFKDMGADGAFAGLPLWQTPTLANAVGFYRDLGEAEPEMPVMVYANPNFFKSDFPPPLWEGIAHGAPTVIACKGGGTKYLVESIAVAGQRIRFIPMETAALEAYELAPEHIKMFWSTSAAMGAEPVVALARALLEGDLTRAAEIDADIQSVPGWIVDFNDFHYYNTQAAKWRFEAAGYNYGPSRAPYNDPLPEAWVRAGEEHGKGWVKLLQKYAVSSAT